MGQALPGDRPDLAPGLGARHPVLRVRARHPQDDHRCCSVTTRAAGVRAVDHCAPALNSQKPRSPGQRGAGSFLSTSGEGLRAVIAERLLTLQRAVTAKRYPAAR
jgi:hypothetical protein